MKKERNECSSCLFDAEKRNLHCGSCDSDFSVETMEQITEAENKASEKSRYDWEKYEPRSFTEEESVNLSSYSCPSCGANITGDDTMGSTVCPYCGNSAIIKEQFSGNLMPDYIIPFKTDKKKAMEKFEEACGKAPFLPDEFKDKKRIEEMTGVYVPFWMFDCDCNAAINYSGKKYHFWSDSDYNYTKTDHYKLVRIGSVGFENIPVDGSEKADDDYMESIEPYDYSEAVEFNTAYLSGFLADKYDVSVEDSIERANKRVKNSTEAMFKETTYEFSDVITESSSVNFSEGKIRYALLPVWMLNLKYEGVNYKYAINGQTGKVVGVYPVCKKKKWLYFAKVSYLCPECHEVFRPSFKSAFFAAHTPTTRKLTCTCCGHTGFCVEVYREESKTEKEKKEKN